MFWEFIAAEENIVDGIVQQIKSVDLYYYLLLMEIELEPDEKRLLMMMVQAWRKTKQDELEYIKKEKEIADKGKGKT